MRWTLDKKLSIMMVLLSTLLLGLLFIFNLYMEQKMFGIVTRNIRELTRSIQITLDEMTKANPDDKKLHDFLKEINAKGVKEIDVIDGGVMKIVASTDPSKKGRTVSDATAELLFKADEGKLVSALKIVASKDPLRKEKRVRGANPDLLFRSEGEMGDYYSIILPVVVQGEHQGYIRMIVDAKDITDDLDSVVRKRMFITAALLLLGCIAAVWLSRSYTRPIRSVANAAGRVSSGDLDTKVEISGRDEVAELGENFNHMVDRLRELRALEEKLRRAEYLATVGELSSHVAHEIRNPLNYISLSVDHLTEKLEDETALSLIRNIKQEIVRLDRLVNEFLQYGKPLTLDIRVVRIGELVDNTIALMADRAKKAKVAIHRDMPDPGIIMRIDYDLMKTCFLNILINAVQSMPGGGEVKISADAEDGFHRIRIEDTGAGLDEQKAAHVFDPFFTTKEEGTGLGLSITKRVVEEHGGKIRFRSRPGEGSTVDIYLPVRS